MKAADGFVFDGAPSTEGPRRLHGAPSTEGPPTGVTRSPDWGDLSVWIGRARSLD